MYLYFLFWFIDRINRILLDLFNSSSYLVLPTLVLVIDIISFTTVLAEVVLVLGLTVFFSTS